MAEANTPSPALRLEGIGFASAVRRWFPTSAFGWSQALFLSLLGPSGGGKTTLLKLIGGYLRPTKGRIFLRDGDATTLPPERRNIGMVFQNYALFPHLTARENVSFGLEMRRVPRAERQRPVESMLDRVGLTIAESGRRPAQLSGGQQQRVALARALGRRKVSVIALCGVGVGRESGADRFRAASGGAGAWCVILAGVPPRHTAFVGARPGRRGPTDAGLGAGSLRRPAAPSPLISAVFLGCELARWPNSW